jgi:ribosomal protein L29
MPDHVSLFAMKMVYREIAQLYTQMREREGF